MPCILSFFLKKRGFLIKEIKFLTNLGRQIKMTVLWKKLEIILVKIYVHLEGFFRLDQLTHVHFINSFSNDLQSTVMCRTEVLGPNFLA